MTNKDELLKNKKLWNPNVAANWSLLLSPAFGAWIHAKNWQELNQPDKAKKSIIWAIAGCIIVIICSFLPKGGGLLPVIFILSWYFSSGKKQMKFFEEHSINYTKKSWTKPLLVAIGILFLYGCVVSTATTMGVLEAGSVSSEMLEADL